MTTSKSKTSASRNEVHRKLRRDILSARLKVALDQKQKKTPDPALKALARVKLPPISTADKQSQGQTGAVDAPRTYRKNGKTVAARSGSVVSRSSRSTSMLRG